MWLCSNKTLFYKSKQWAGLGPWAAVCGSLSWAMLSYFLLNLTAPRSRLLALLPSYRGNEHSCRLAGQRLHHSSGLSASHPLSVVSPRASPSAACRHQLVTPTSLKPLPSAPSTPPSGSPSCLPPWLISPPGVAGA